MVTVQTGEAAKQPHYAGSLSKISNDAGGHKKKAIHLSVALQSSSKAIALRQFAKPELPLYVQLGLPSGVGWNTCLPLLTESEGDSLGYRGQRA